MPYRPPQFRSRFEPKRPTDAQRRGTAAQRGYDGDWRKARLAHLRRHPICVFAEEPCLPHRCEVAATVVDHVTPLSRGGARLDPANFRSVCTRCHQALTNNLRLNDSNTMPLLPRSQPDEQRHR